MGRGCINKEQGTKTGRSKSAAGKRYIEDMIFGEP
jgi:hypothetical protein